MKSINLYENKNSFLNGLTPGVKALYVLTAMSIPAILDSNLLKIDFILISIALLLTSGVLKKTYPMIIVSGLIMVTVVLVQGLFGIKNVTPVWTVGPLVFYQEGLITALEIILNILNIIFSVSVLILTTKPSDIADALISKGMSPKLGYIFTSLFMLIPQMSSRIGVIADAQRSRGMEVEGNLFIRIKAFLPLISPVIMSSFTDIRERTIALEVRGFSSKTKKTFLNEFVPSKANKSVFIALILVMASAIIYRICKIF